MTKNDSTRFNVLLKEVYKCDKKDLKELLEKIEFELKHSKVDNQVLLLAKRVATTRLLNT